MGREKSGHFLTQFVFQVVNLLVFRTDGLGEYGVPFDQGFDCSLHGIVGQLAH